jgi:DNA-binding SARP family transcriptional activator
VSSEIAVRLLGPLEVELAGRRVRFEGVKQRKLFMVLALRAPDAVSADELVTVLWGEEPPSGAAQALQKQVSRLRQRLGDDSPVRYRPAGYALEIDPQTIDARRFEDLLEDARVALGRQDPERAAANLRAALALWRGEALADHRFDDFAQREIARLEDLRRSDEADGSGLFQGWLDQDIDQARARLSWLESQRASLLAEP